MRHCLSALFGAALLVLGLSSASADEKLKTVTSFSILGDMVKQVGGDRVDVTTLVGPNGDAHAFSPTPADARTLAGADVFFVNGLGFEGWMERLETSSGFEGTTVVASEGITPLKFEGHHDGHEEKGHAHGEKEHGHDHHDHAAEDDHDEDRHAEKAHDHGDTDPHAWQSLANGQIYVANIRDALIAADPDGKAIYEANADKYLTALRAEDEAAKAAIAALPEAHRRIITSHDAFGYFAQSYGLEVIAPESAEGDASARDVAEIIRQIRERKIPAVFLENVSDPRLLDQIAKETDAEIGGTLYSDALSEKDGPAPTYLDMFRHNVGTLTAALSS